jgi:hypothetical protein
MFSILNPHNIENGHGLRATIIEMKIRIRGSTNGKGQHLQNAMTAIKIIRFVPRSEVNSLERRSNDLQR